jgi:hypothetical protein
MGGTPFAFHRPQCQRHTARASWQQAPDRGMSRTAAGLAADAVWRVLGISDDAATRELAAGGDVAKSSTRRPAAATSAAGPSTTRKPRAGSRIVPVANSDAPAGSAIDALEPDRAEIAGRAYELFLAEGSCHGRDVEHWLQAEQELRQRQLTSAA